MPPWNSHTFWFASMKLPVTNIVTCLDMVPIAQFAVIKLSFLELMWRNVLRWFVIVVVEWFRRQNLSIAQVGLKLVILQPLFHETSDNIITPGFWEFTSMEWKSGPLKRFSLFLRHQQSLLKTSLQRCSRTRNWIKSSTLFINNNLFQNNCDKWKFYFTVSGDYFKITVSTPCLVFIKV